MSDAIVFLGILIGGVFVYSQVYPDDFASFKQSMFPTDAPKEKKETGKILPEWFGTYYMYSLNESNKLYNTQIFVVFDEKGKITSDDRDTNNLWAPYVYDDKQITNTIQKTFFPVTYSNGTINVYANNKIAFSFVKYVPTSPPPISTTRPPSLPPLAMAGNWKLFEETPISIALEPDGTINSSDELWNKSRYDDTGIIYFEGLIVKNEINTLINDVIIVYDGKSRNIKHLLKKIDQLTSIVTQKPIPTLAPLLNRPSAKFSGYWKVFKAVEPAVSMLLKSNGKIESVNAGWNNATYDATRIISSSGLTTKDISVNVPSYNVISFTGSPQLLLKTS